MLWPISTGLARTLPLLLGIFTSPGIFAPPNGPTWTGRTEYARINPPVIDGEVNVQDPDEWRFAAGNSDYWRVVPTPSSLPMHPRRCLGFARLR
jgi:hypothetical protein